MHQRFIVALCTLPFALLTCINSFGQSGCTQPSACNYDATATTDDGSCTMPGCTVRTACNYNPLAGCDNGTCSYEGCSFESPELAMRWEEVPIPEATEAALISSYPFNQPEGMRCLRLYLCTDHPEWDLISLYGDIANGLIIARGDFTDPRVFQHPDGGPLASQVSPDTFASAPTLEFDSWFCVGNSPYQNQAYAAIDGFNWLTEWETYAEGPFGANNVDTDIATDPYAPTALGLPDEQGRILIAQFTIPSINASLLAFQLNATFRKVDENGTPIFPLTLAHTTRVTSYLPFLQVSPSTGTVDTGCMPLASYCNDPSACNYLDGIVFFSDNELCCFPGDPCDDGLPLSTGDIIQPDCSCGNGGCMDVLACNYDPEAVVSNGSCYYIGEPCDDNDPLTGQDQYSETCTCEGVQVSGCTDPWSTNYDPVATVDDGSCTCNQAGTSLFLNTDNYGGETSWELRDALDQVLYIGSGYGSNTAYTAPFCLVEGCYTFTIFDTFGDGISAGGNGDYSITDAEGNVLVSLLNADFGDEESQQFCVTVPEVVGCMQEQACNYDPTANVSGACTLPDGCTDPAACNYAPAANCDDGSCLFATSWWVPADPGPAPVFACEGPAGFFAVNAACFSTVLGNNPNCLSAWDQACVDLYCGCSGTCGCSNPAACNYLPGADLPSEACLLPDGCTNPLACNYDPSAQCDDGSCDLTDSDLDGTPDCADLCPTDPFKTEPGTCGCGVLDTDSDGDGMLDCEETLAGTDPTNPDSDGDGLSDSLELEETGTDPLDPDSDMDGCNDLLEALLLCPDSTADSGCPQDQNNDGQIDTQDLLAVLGAFGSSCESFLP